MFNQCGWLGSCFIGGQELKALVSSFFFSGNQRLQQMMEDMVSQRDGNLGTMDDRYDADKN